MTDVKGERRRALWDAVLSRPAASALVALGVLLVPFSAVIYAIDRGAAALGFAVLGLAGIVAGASLPRVEEAEFGPSGARLKLSPFEPAASVELSKERLVTREEVDEPSEMVAAARAYLAGEALGVVLAPREADDELGDCHFRLYLYDVDEDRLLPVITPIDTDTSPSTETWEVGKGATGTAYRTGRFVHVLGEAIWDTTYGITEEQSARFRHLTAVASMPVANAAGDVIAVITATSDVAGGGDLADEERAYLGLLSRSILVARALVDLLGWFPDQYDSPDG